MSKERIRVRRGSHSTALLYVQGDGWGVNYDLSYEADNARFRTQYPGLSWREIPLDQTIEFEREGLAYDAHYMTYQKPAWHRWVRVESDEEVAAEGAVQDWHDCLEEGKPVADREWTARRWNSGYIDTNPPERAEAPRVDGFRFHPFEFFDLFGIDPEELPVGEELVLKRYGMASDYEPKGGVYPSTYWAWDWHAKLSAEDQKPIHRGCQGTCRQG